MSNKYHTACNFRNATAGRRMAANYRKQFGIGLDGQPRRYGKQKKIFPDSASNPSGRESRNQNTVSAHAAAEEGGITTTDTLQQNLRRDAIAPSTRTLPVGGPPEPAAV